jgi:diguanylate cyclase (GGDEF)-like protein
MSETDGHSQVTFGISDRNRVADERDRTADAHDEDADVRDTESEARDARADARDNTQSSANKDAAEDRAEAKRDRQDSAGNRKDSGDDREAASADRVHAAQERAASLLDGLTGVHKRDPGLLELARDVTKAHRTGTPFVLAFIDIDGLKTLNDADGHAAGDELLRQVVDTIRGVVREYDLIVRYGGDEFICGLLDLDLVDAQRRFQDANASLAVTREAQISVGLAELAPEESLEELVARADSVMYAQRQTRRSVG